MDSITRAPSLSEEILNRIEGLEETTLSRDDVRDIATIHTFNAIHDVTTRETIEGIVTRKFYSLMNGKGQVPPSEDLQKDLNYWMAEAHRRENQLQDWMVSHGKLQREHRKERVLCSEARKNWKLAFFGLLPAGIYGLVQLYQALI